MKEQDIEKRVIDSLDELNTEHSELLDVSANERSINHWLAVILQERFPEYHVDVEYNRISNSDDHIKRYLKCFDGNGGPLSPEDSDAKTVYPDIIIHERGKSCRNLLLIEVKKRSSNGEDLDKVECLVGELGYACGAYIEIDDRKEGRTSPETWIKKLLSS